MGEPPDIYLVFDWEAGYFLSMTDEAESFARDIENGRAVLNRPPTSSAWE